MRFIQPKDNFKGEFTFLGDKSITHRAVMLGGIAHGQTLVKNLSLGEDCLATVKAMERLGAKIELDGKNLKITGVQTLANGLEIDCKNSATTMRLLAGLLAGKGVRAKLYGDSSLSLRPMERVAEPLRKLGAKIQTTAKNPPITVEKSKILGGEIVLNVPSAQVKGAVLLAGLNGENKTTVTEGEATRDHTERMLEKMNAKIARNGLKTTIEQSELKGTEIEVPADISSASYFMALGALKGETLCKNVGVNPTRTGILRAFDLLGVDYSLTSERTVCGEEIADITVKKSTLNPICLKADATMIDELPLIALLCAFAKGESKIWGAEELKFKESNRILATAELINSLGGKCEATDDGFVIQGNGALTGGKVESGKDHRIAMTGAIGLLASKKGGELVGGQVCAVSFPDFFEKLGV